MSQQIRILQCVECSLYQVDIVKKTNKWQCKVCQVKQMVLKEFFRGSGAECRAQVQHLNQQHGEQQHAQEERKILAAQQDQANVSSSVEPFQHSRGPSKWANYIDEPIAETTSGPRIHIQKEEFYEPENTSSTRNQSGLKRVAQNEFVVNKKPSSKWQNFV